MTKIILELELSEEHTKTIIEGVYAKVKADAEAEKANLPNWIPASEAAALLKCNTRSVIKKINAEGYYKGKVHGRKWMVEKNSLDEYMRLT